MAKTPDHSPNPADPGPPMFEIRPGFLPSATPEAMERMRKIAREQPITMLPDAIFPVPVDGNGRVIADGVTHDQFARLLSLLSLSPEERVFVQTSLVPHVPSDFWNVLADYLEEKSNDASTRYREMAIADVQERTAYCDGCGGTFAPIADKIVLTESGTIHSAVIQCPRCGHCRYLR